MGESARVYLHIAGARIRSDAQYRASFAIFTLSQMLVTASDLVAIWALFQQVDTLAGWSSRQVLFLYGLSMASFAVADAAVSAVEQTGDYVRTGDLDRLLVRPVSLLAHLTAEQFALRRLGRIAIATVLLAVVVPRTPIEWTAGKVLLTITTILAGTVTFSALFVLTSSLSFWLVTAREAANAFTYGGKLMANYPIHLFGEWLRRAALFIVPIGAVAYLPGIYILDAPNPLGIPRFAQILSPLAAVPTVLAASIVWRAGRRHYTSTGS